MVGANIRQLLSTIMIASIFDADGVLRGQEVGQISEWLAPRAIADLWVEGDDDDRAQIDRMLDAARKRQWAEQETFFRF